MGVKCCSVILFVMSIRPVWAKFLSAARLQFGSEMDPDWIQFLCFLRDRYDHWIDLQAHSRGLILYCSNQSHEN